MATHTAMAKCNDFICFNDAITYEDIEVDKCVAYKPENCLNCTTINDTLNNESLRKQFLENPIKALFQADVSADADINAKFIENIKKTCKDIKFGEISTKNTKSIVLPDLQQLQQDYETIIKRIESKGYKLDTSNAYKFIMTIFEIANIPSHLKLKEELTNNNTSMLSRNIMDILNKSQCSSRLIHDSTIIPINIQLFLGKLVLSNDIMFQSVIEYLNTKPQGCLEAVINKATNIIDQSSVQNGGKKMRKKSKRKYKTSKKTKKHNK